MNGTEYTVDAEQRNRGIELSAYGSPADGVRLYSGLTWIEAKLTETSNPATQGNTAVGVPRLQGSVNAEWDLPSMRDMTLIGTVFYTGSQFVDQTNERELSASTVVDLGARYRSLIGGKKVVWRATLRNATGKDYWAGASTWGTLIQGAPRTFLLSATVDF
jgi:iron complex outermembrane receptor protein